MSVTLELPECIYKSCITSAFSFPNIVCHTYDVTILEINVQSSMNEWMNEWMCMNVQATVLHCFCMNRWLLTYYQGITLLGSTSGTGLLLIRIRIPNPNSELGRSVMIPLARLPGTVEVVEPVLGDLWFGRPQSLARIVSNNKVPDVSDHLLNATGDRVIWSNRW